MSHSSRPYVPTDASREESGMLHNAWNKLYVPIVPPPPPQFFPSSSGPPPPRREWWNAPPHEPWQSLPADHDSRRINFTTPSRINLLPSPSRGYDPLYTESHNHPEFVERPSWGSSRGDDRPLTPFNERALDSEHWSSSPASSVVRERDRDWDRNSRVRRTWSGSRRAVSSPYSHADRPLLEPSQAWRDRERQLSIEQNTASGPVFSNVSDFQTRRFRQLPAPSSPLPPGPPNHRFAPPPFSRRAGHRRPQHRMSARISARPKRDPSPSSSEYSVRSHSPPRSPRSPYVRSESRVIFPMEETDDRRPLKGPGKNYLPPFPKEFALDSTFLPSRDAEPSPSRSASPSWATKSSIRSSVHSSPRLVTTALETSTPQKASPDVEETASVRAISPPQKVMEPGLPGMRFLTDIASNHLNLASPRIVGELHKNSSEESTDQAKLSESLGSTQVEDSSLSRITVETAVHYQDEHVSLNEETQGDQGAAVLENTADLNPPSPLTSRLIPLSQLQPAESLMETAIPKTEQEQSLVFEAARQGTMQVDQRHADIAIPGPLESSPLSEPVLSSPLLDILLEDADESSMDVDNGFSFTSSSDSEPTDDFIAAVRVSIRGREVEDTLLEERYDSVFRANHQILDTPYSRVGSSNEELVQEVLSDSLRPRLGFHADISQILLDRFRKQAERLAAHTQHLREEYKSYHDQWVSNCRKLDQSMASSASHGAEGLPMPTGRVTRRSAALGDTVRSDLEMEQIIASLGNEDMTDPNVLAIRNTAVIPDLVTMNPLEINVSFDDDNGLVDNPAEFFDVYDTLGRWTEDEKEIFVRKYGLFPKQFGAIASFLPNKTQAQCVMFYYLHKKELVDFRMAISQYGPKRKRRGKKTRKGKGNALLADIVKPSHNRAKDESTLHKHSDRFLEGHVLESEQLSTRRPFTGQINVGETSSSRSDIIAQRAGGLSHQIEEEFGGKTGRTLDEALIDPTETHSHSPDIEPPSGNAPLQQTRDHQGASADINPPKTPLETVVDTVPSKPSYSEKGKEKEKRPPGRPPKKSKAKALNKAGGSSVNQKSTISYVWSKKEEALFLQLLARHGKDFEKIAAEMPAKTALQCRNYFRNHFNDYDLDEVASMWSNVADYFQLPGGATVSSFGSLNDIRVF